MLCHFVGAGCCKVRMWFLHLLNTLIIVATKKLRRSGLLYVYTCVELHQLTSNVIILATFVIAMINLSCQDLLTVAS